MFPSDLPENIRKADVFKKIKRSIEKKMTTKSVYVLDQQETKKDTPTEVFFCEYFEIIKNIYSEEHLRTAASATSCLFSFKLVHLFKKKKKKKTYILRIYVLDFTHASKRAS